MSANTSCNTIAAGCGGAGPGGLILLYHRVAPAECDPQLLAVGPRRFAEHLKVLRRIAVPMPLREMVRRAAEHSLPPRAVALTFDDGYVDNLVFARPLLTNHDVPATVFVTAGYLDGRREFWWDELERMFLQPGRLPESLRLEWGCECRQWELNGSSLYSQEEYRRRVRWNVLRADQAGPRQRLYMELCGLIRPMAHDVRERVLDELSAWSGLSRRPRAWSRAMNAEELGRLTEGGLVEVGGHTMTHPVLSTLKESDQREELMAGKACLEEVFGTPVTSFSYPYGTRRDYTAVTVQLVREAGLALACSNFRGLVRPGGDMFQLPRLIVRDWDGDAFARRLEEEWSRD